jgi:hypothetical protein
MQDNLNDYEYFRQGVLSPIHPRFRAPKIASRQSDKEHLKSMLASTTEV